MKFCVNCGNELAEAAKFCNRCGQSRNTQPTEETQLSTTDNEHVVNQEEVKVQKPEGTTPRPAISESASLVGAPTSGQPSSLGAQSVSSEPVGLVAQPASNVASQPGSSPLKHSNKRKWSIISIAAAGVVIIIIAVLVIFNQFVEKNPKNLYLLAEVKSFNSGTNPLVSVVEQAIRMQKNGKQPTEIETIISGGIDIFGESGIDSRLGGLIEDSAIKYLYQHDPETAQTNYSLSYLYDNESIISAILLTDAKRMAIKLPEVSEQTYLLRNEELDNKKGSADRSSSSELELTKKYTSLLTQRLQDEHFTLTEDVPYQYGGKSAKLRKITIKLSKDEFKKLILDYIDTLRHDDELLRRVVSSSSITSAVGNGGISGFSDNDIEEIVETLRDELYSAKLGLNQVSFSNGFTMDVMLDKKGKIIARDLKFDIRDDEYGDKVSFTFKSESKLEKNVPGSTFALEMRSSGSERGRIEVTGESTGELKGESGQWNLELSIVGSENQSTFLDSDIAIQAERKKGSDGIETTYTFESNWNADQGENRLTVEGELLHTFNNKNKDKSINNHYDVQLDIEVDSGYNQGEINLELAIDSTSRSGSDVKLAPFDVNQVSIPDLSENELYELQEDLSDDFINYMEKVADRIPLLRDL